MERTIQLIINKSEITAGTRGASLGAEAMMVVARTKGNQFFSKYPIEKINDVNHLLDLPVKYPFAKRIDGLVEIFDAISIQVDNTLTEGKFPLVIAADHGSAGGTIAGIKQHFPDKRLGAIWIDAHGDLHTPYTTPTGNMHGMPLATALAENNQECQRNEVEEEVADLWSVLKNMGTGEQKIQPEDLVFIAVRDTEKEEDAIMKRLNIKNHTVDEVRSKGKENILKEIQNQLNECDIIYVSFDVDSMDPKHTSHGTGTPVEHGLTPEEAEFFLTAMAQWRKTVCVEFVEINPCLDEKINKMAEVSFDLLEKTTKALIK